MRAPSSRLLFMVPVICLLFSVCFVQTAPLARHKNNRKFGTGNGQAFVSSLVRKLGLVDFYTNLYRGVRSTFLVGRDSERTKSNNGGSHTYNSHAYSQTEGIADHDEDEYFFPSDDSSSYIHLNEVEDYYYKPMSIRPSTEAPIQGIYIMESPNLSTPYYAPVPFRTTTPKVRTLPPKYHHQYFVRNTVPYTPTTPRPRYYPEIFTNYSSVKTPWSPPTDHKVVPIYAVTEPTPTRDFYFTTKENEHKDIAQLTTTLEPPIHKMFFLPPTTQPPKTVVKSLLPLRKKKEELDAHTTTQTAPNGYETTILPNIFVSSMPSMQYHRVNNNKGPVFKDPLYSSRRETTTYATLQPRLMKDGDVKTTTIGPIIFSKGAPRPRRTNTFAPLTRPDDYPVHSPQFEESQGIMQTADSQTIVTTLTTSTPPSSPSGVAEDVANQTEEDAPVAEKEQLDCPSSLARAPTDEARQEDDEMEDIAGQKRKQGVMELRIFKEDLPFMRVLAANGARLKAEMGLVSEESLLARDASEIFPHDIIVEDTIPDDMTFAYRYNNAYKAKERERVVKTKEDENHKKDLAEDLRLLIALIEMERSEEGEEAAETGGITEVPLLRGAGATGNNYGLF